MANEVIDKDEDFYADVTSRIQQYIDGAITAKELVNSLAVLCERFPKLAHPLPEAAVNEVESQYSSGGVKKDDIAEEDLTTYLAFHLETKKGQRTIIVENEGQNIEFVMSGILRRASFYGHEVTSISVIDNKAEDWSEVC
jgi:hypothetical protein